MSEHRCNSFHELRRRHRQGLDYRIVFTDARSRATILAPHGGGIEPHTSRIARRIAGADYNCYCFEGMKPAGNRRLHIPSRCFDEPAALDLVSGSDVVVTVHGCRGGERRVFLGGRDRRLKTAMTAELAASGIDVSVDVPQYPGLHSANICNRGRTEKGIQLELTRGLREHSASVDRLVRAVRAVVARTLHHLSSAPPAPESTPCV